MMRRTAGFTLIEMLVVVAIIGLLSSIILVGLGDVRKDARDTRRVADIRQLQNALEIYYSTNQSYPTNIYDLLETAPYDPILDPLTGSVQPYGYERLSPNSYLLGACLEGERQTGVSHISENIRNGITNYGEGCNCDDIDDHVYCVKS
ncbi:MAG: type II secretion system protein [Candidatus Jorgensenbacteria bacterium]|nr:type II secretion system protein [Candidatus Jorgensenbacteria bacterium]